MENRYLKKLDIKLIEGEYKNPVQGQVRDPEHVYDVFRDLKDRAQETLLGVYLSPTLEVNVYDVLSVGGEDVTLALPHEIFGHAIITRSKAFLLIHNHPSGDPTPSAADREIMREVKKGAEALRLSFLDFIVVGDMRDETKKNYWSMFAEGCGGEYALGSIDF